MERNDKLNCFDEIRSVSLPKKDLSIQTMFACEKHYMELLRKYKDEINFLDEKMRQLREEQTEFRLKIVPSVRRHLEKMKESMLKLHTLGCNTMWKAWSAALL